MQTKSLRMPSIICNTKTVLTHTSKIPIYDGKINEEHWQVLFNFSKNTFRIQLTQN
jgi:hypothetical protein